MTPRTAELAMVLRDLDRRCGLFGSALVTGKGLMMSSSLPQGTDERAVSAMAASILSIGQRVGNELDSGPPVSILVNGTDKSVALVAVNGFVIIAMACTDSEISLINLELAQAAERIKEILGTGS